MPIVTTSDASSSTPPTLSDLKKAAKHLNYCLNHLRNYSEKKGKHEDDLNSAKKDAANLSKQLGKYFKIASSLPLENPEVVDKDNLLKSEFLRQIHSKMAKIKSLLA